MLPLLTLVGERNSQLLLLMYKLSVNGLFSTAMTLSITKIASTYYGGDLLHSSNIDTACSAFCAFLSVGCLLELGFVVALPGLFFLGF